MKKIADFIVSKRYWVLGIALCLTLACAFLSQQVEVNSDMTKYLPDDFSMKIGMDLMNEEFPEMEGSQTIRVMVEGIDEGQEAALLSELESLKYVDNVSYNDSADYHQDGYVLYILNTSYGYGSDEELAIEHALESEFDSYDLVFRNDDINQVGIPIWILAIALSIVLIILLIMCSSWFEPVLFLLTIGIAVLLNAGTNIFLGTVSNITNSIAAILQLVLSMDYSIILMNRYRQERELCDDHVEAMKRALANAFSSVAGSAFTTIVGLLMLVFMQFKIGMDLGIVLGKGVFISMVCVFTILPGLILLCDKLIQKTAKRELHVPMGAVARFSHRFRYVLTGVFAVLFIGFYFWHGNTETAFNLEKTDPIAEVFPKTNMFVLLYDNTDEDAVRTISEELENDSDVKQVLGYPNLLGKEYTAVEMADSIDELGENLGVELGSGMELDESLLNLIYYDYYDGTEKPIAMGDFLTFLTEDLMEDETFSGKIDSDISEKLDMLAPFANKDNLTREISAAELAGMLGMESDMVTGVFQMASMQSGTPIESMSMVDFINLILNQPAIADQLDAGTQQQLRMMQQLMNFVISGKEFSAEEMTTFLESVAGESVLEETTVKLMYRYYASRHKDNTEQVMNVEQLIRYMSEEMANDNLYADLIDDDMRSALEDAQGKLDEGIEMVKSDKYSRMIVQTTLPQEAEETTAFIEKLNEVCDSEFQGKYYLIGNSAMNYEMSKTFDDELLTITLLTSIAIFVIVAISFRSLIIPALLVLLVQCGIYITVTLLGVQGINIYYLALLMVECILMGATIDYGILYTNYYRESRETLDVKESIAASYKGSIHTILTSGLIMVLVTGLISFLYDEPTIAQICRTLSIGVLSAMALIVFILPGMLATFDKWVAKKKK